jgi:opacity protein-like surface antigen
MSRNGGFGFCAAALIALAALAPAAAADDVKIDSETFGGLEARCIGPAAMGGRIAALDALEANGRLVIYVGSAGGGVWKSAKKQERG